MVRFPNGMRDRIKAAAEENGRSMNAEIIAVLEEKYPAPSAIYQQMPHSDLDIGVAHWAENDNVWVPMNWDLWVAFRKQGQLDSGRDGSRTGRNYFAVLVLNEDGTLANIIPHMYILDELGRIIGSPFDAAPKERLAEYNRVFLLPTHTAAELKFLHDLDDEIHPQVYPPEKAHSRLRDFILEHTDKRGVDEVLAKTGFSLP